MHTGCATSRSSAIFGGFSALRKAEFASADYVFKCPDPAPESTPPLKDGASAVAGFSLLILFCHTVSAMLLKCHSVRYISGCTFWTQRLVKIY